MMHVSHMIVSIVSNAQIHAVCDFRRKFHFRNNKISNLTTEYQRIDDIFTIILDVDHGGLERGGLENVQRCMICTGKKIRFSVKYTHHFVSWACPDYFAISSLFTSIFIYIWITCYSHYDVLSGLLYICIYLHNMFLVLRCLFKFTGVLMYSFSFHCKLHPNLFLNLKKKHLTTGSLYFA